MERRLYRLYRFCERPDLTMLNARDDFRSYFSSAARKQAVQGTPGWNLRWISSFGSDFNYDFHVTLDSTVTPVQYNYRDENLDGKDTV